MLVDTHCHLDAAEFDGDRDAVIDRAGQCGVDAIVVPAIHRGNFETVRALSEQRRDARSPTIFFALGIHPLLVPDAREEDLVHLRARVAKLREHPGFVGIGEIGIDLFVKGLPLEPQQHFLDEQLRIARDFDCPVILHVRRSADQVARGLRRFMPPSGIAHAYNGSEQQASVLIDMGMCLGFGGAMTFDRARNIRRLARSLPVERIVLETDSPDISPEWIHPGRNEPAEVSRIADVLAELRGVDREAVLRSSWQAALRALPALKRLEG